MRPSTVQTSRFSFFSREAIFAFAPWSTASTCAIESFQRKPNGGNSSSTEYARAADRRRQTTLIARIRPIATPLRDRTHFACQFFIFVWVARIFDRHPNYHYGGGKIARTVQFGQIAEARHGGVNRQIASPRQY